MLQGNDPYREPSFSLSNRIFRALWYATYLLFFRPSPRPANTWRVMILRVFGAQIGSGCHIYPNIKIWAPWNIKIGNYSGIGDGANIYCMDTIHIGDYVSISQGAFLCAGTHDYNSANMQLVLKPITISSYVWICAEAFIHPGIFIPEGVVIGARSVVTRDPSDAWAVYAGNPCKKVGIRKKYRD